MKKKNKQKFLNFWNKIKKPLIILSFIGNIFFLMFIIVGCVGAKKQKSQQVAAENGNFQVLTLRGTSWRFNGFIQYTPTGRDLMQSRDYTEEEGEYTYTEGYLLHYTIEDINYTSGDNIDNPINFVSINFGAEYEDTYLSGVQINGNYIWEYGTQRTKEIYHANSEAPNDEYYWDSFLPTTNTEYGSVIHIADEYVNNSPTENLDFIQWFYDNATLLNEVEPFSFTFNNQINYNGYFGQPISSTFINSDGNQTKKVIIDLPTFSSNNTLFNQIVVWYLNGGSMSYQSSNGTIQTNTNTQTWYYLSMEYVNTYTNESVTVNYRNFMVEGSTYLVNGSTWKAASYRYLIFGNSLTPQQIESLECFNNDYFSGFGTAASDVGIGNVFALLGGAFTSLTALWSIQLLPGISIGLLLFMPLIVGLIITIIWIVKR